MQLSQVKSGLYHLKRRLKAELLSSGKGEYSVQLSFIRSFQFAVG